MFRIIYCSIFLITLVSCEKDKKDETNNEDTFVPKIENELEKETLILINQYRYNHGLDTLISNDFIVEIARQHSKNMATGKTKPGHDGFDERGLEIATELGSGTAAENVALSNESAKIVVNLWLNSPDHKVNIDGDFSVTGIGIATDKNGYSYYTQLFYKPEK